MSKKKVHKPTQPGLVRRYEHVLNKTHGHDFGVSLQQIERANYVGAGMCKCGMGPQGYRHRLLVGAGLDRILCPYGEV